MKGKLGKKEIQSLNQEDAKNIHLHLGSGWKKNKCSLWKSKIQASALRDAEDRVYTVHEW